MDERRARRPRPLLSKLYDALACRRQRGQRQHQHGQRRAGRPHPEGLPRQRHRRAGRRGVKHQPAQAPGQQRRKQRAGRQRRPRQQQPLHQRQYADLHRGRPAALQHRDFRGPRPNYHTRRYRQVVGQNARNQKHHQKQGNPRQQQPFFMVFQYPRQPG